MKTYNRKGELYMEAPQLNEDILPLCKGIPKQRDDHFVETQNCVGTAIIALGAAIFLLLESPNEGVDEDEIKGYVSHAGQMMIDVFHQQSVGRKSYITPKLGDDMKDMVNSLISDELLYGNKLKDKINTVTEINKVCDNIKKKVAQKYTLANRNQGNPKYPPVNNRQVGYQSKRRQLKFKPRTYKTPQTSSRTAERKKTTSSSSRR